MARSQRSNSGGSTGKNNNDKRSLRSNSSSGLKSPVSPTGSTEAVVGNSTGVKSSSTTATPRQRKTPKTPSAKGAIGGKGAASAAKGTPRRGSKEKLDESRTLQNVGYPIYAMAVLGDRMVMGGGGGSTKTGVKNCVSGFRLPESASSVKSLTDSSKCDLHLQLPQNLGAVWNMDVHPSKKLVVCGIENGSILFAVDGQTLTYLDEIRTTFTAEEYAEEEQQPEKEEEEKQTKKQSNKQPTVPPPTEYSENYQKCVRFVSDESIVTGGSDGVVRIWRMNAAGFDQYPQPVFLCQHDYEINDVDVNEECVASVSKMSVAITLLDPLTTHGVPSADFFPPTQMVYANRDVNARFIRLGKGVSERMLFFVHIMMEPKRSGKGFDRVSTLFKWSLDNGKPVKHRQIATSAATAFAISDDGKFLGYGTSDGHMGVLNAVTMKRVTGERMFQWPVTAVAFTADGKFMFGTCGSECKALSTRRKLKGLDVVLYLSLLILVLAYLYAMGYIQQLNALTTKA